MTKLLPTYPTPQHAAAAASIVNYFQRQSDIEALLLIGSTARGKASPESCLDFLVLVRPEILAVHQAVCEPERPVVRMVVLFPRHCLHRPIPSHRRSAGAEERVVIRARRVGEEILRKELAVNLHPHAIA